MGSLRNKVFLWFVFVLVLMQTLSLWTVYQTNQAQLQREVNYRLDNAVSLFNTQFAQRSYYLSVFSETAAKDFGLKEVFNSDRRSFLIALNNHRQRIDADIAIAVNKERTIIGQLLKRETEKGNKVRVGEEMDTQLRSGQWLEASSEQLLLYQLDSDVYQVRFSPLKSGSEIIGWIAFGFRLDQAMAQEFSDLTGFHIDFMRNDSGNEWNVITSASAKNQPELDRFGPLIMMGTAPETVIAASEPLREAHGLELSVAIYGSRSSFIEAIRDGWWGLLLLEMGIVLISLLAAYVIANTISKPVRKLVKQAKQIARGNYNQQVEIDESNELGQLAGEFNKMQASILSREEEITYRASHDPLTDLPNRNQVVPLLEKLLQDPQPKFSLIHMDIRRTKEVNDTLGYDIGDRMIKKVARRLASLDDTLLLGHLGGDEFILIVEALSTHEIESWMELISHKMDQQAQFDDLAIYLQLNIGVARARIDASTPNELLQKADTALTQSKRLRTTYQCYHAEMDSDSKRCLSLLHDLKHAIDSNQLVLFYQPKMDAKRRVIGHLEALVRWQHPQRGMIPPDHFISIAEQTGQINNLTHWVLREAARQYNCWRKMGLNMSIAVNISAENLKDLNFTTKLKAMYEEFDLPDDALSLEVTESAVVSDPETAVSMLCELRDAGIKLSIDDYGTGYSSLAQLKQLPVQELKIDQSFVRYLTENQDDQIIVRSTIRLAHDMGLSVVAEGVEDEDALKWLSENGCDLIQGYFVSRPQPANVLEDWLSDCDYPPVKMELTA